MGLNARFLERRYSTRCSRRIHVRLQTLRGCFGAHATLLRHTPTSPTSDSCHFHHLHLFHPSPRLSSRLSYASLLLSSSQQKGESKDFLFELERANPDHPQRIFRIGETQAIATFNAGVPSQPPGASLLSPDPLRSLRCVLRVPDELFRGGATLGGRCLTHAPTPR